MNVYTKYGTCTPNRYQYKVNKTFAAGSTRGKVRGSSKQSHGVPNLMAIPFIAVEAFLTEKTKQKQNINGILMLTLQEKSEGDLILYGP